MLTTSGNTRKCSGDLSLELVGACSPSTLLITQKLRINNMIKIQLVESYFTVNMIQKRRDIHFFPMNPMNIHINLLGGRSDSCAGCGSS